MATAQMVCHLHDCICGHTQRHFAANNLFFSADKTWHSVTAQIHRRHYQNRFCICNPLVINPNLLKL